VHNFFYKKHLGAKKVYAKESDIKKIGDKYFDTKFQEKNHRNKKN
jgi:hypothetical protein